MGKEFEIVWEGEFAATPEQVWAAVTTEEAAWLFNTDEMPGVDVVREEPTHHVSRMEGPDGWFNQLEQVIEDRGNGTTSLRWVHSGVFQEDWDAQYDGASKHTAFYMHTLGQYLENFAGKPVVFADIQGPAESTGPAAFHAVRDALGLTEDSQAGESIGVSLPGTDATGAVLDYVDTLFIGIRTEDALYRFFGRNAFGAPVAVTVHHFGNASAEEQSEAWGAWLAGLYS